MNKVKELEVIHEPNPCDIHSSERFPKDPFRFMWYYKTTVTNNTAKPLKVIRFESYSRVFGNWEPNNVLRKELGNTEFIEWYNDEKSLTEDGCIPPKGQAVCNVNWHGFRGPFAKRVKWAYTAVDDEGKEHFAEEEIISKPVMNGKGILWILWYLMLLGIMMASISAMFNK